MPGNLKHWRPGIWIFLSVLGPAIIAGTANNDAGGISTYSYVGSRFGYALLWVLVLNFLTLACTQEIGTRLGTYTGKGLAALIRERFGVRWTFLALGTLLIANLAVATSEFAGIAASLGLFGWSKYITLPIIAVLVWSILYKGSFKKIERFFLIISSFFLVYIVAAVMARPDWGAVGSSLLQIDFSLDPIYFIALLGLIGTTVTPWGQFFIQSYVVDKGIHPRFYRFTRWEVYASALATCVIAAAIIITTALLFKQGIVIDSADKAALALQPLLGRFAEIIFAFGFLNASLLGAFILPLTTAYSICDAFGWEQGMNTTWKQAPQFYGLMAICIFFPAFYVLLPNLSLFRVMILAQVVNGMLLPVILIFLVVLLRERTKLGLPKGGRVSNFIYSVITWETILRLSVISIMLVAFTVFPEWLEKLRIWWNEFTVLH